MEKLPDELLVEVLGHLGPRELLGAVRAVCRRWRALAVDPAVWRWRRVVLSHQDPPQFAARLLDEVPCVAELTLASLPGEEVVRAAAATRCAAARLRVTATTTAADLLRVLRPHRDTARRLEVDLPGTHGGDQAGRAVQLVLRMRRLEELRLSGLRAVGALAPAQCPLRVLQLSSCHPRGVREVVRACTASLERLDLEYCGCPRDLPALLAACPRLHTAAVEANADLRALEACSALRHLTVVFDDEEFYGADFPLEPEALAGFFRGEAARRLRSLHLKVDEEGEEAALLGCVAALAESGGAALESLRLDLWFEADMAGALGAALRRLPCLRELELSAAEQSGRAALRALAASASAPPSLQRVRLADAGDIWRAV